MRAVHARGGNHVAVAINNRKSHGAVPSPCRRNSGGDRFLGLDETQTVETKHSSPLMLMPKKRAENPPQARNRARCVIFVRRNFQPNGNQMASQRDIAVIVGSLRKNPSAAKPPMR